MTKSEPSTAETEPNQQAALGRATGSGAAWMFAGTIAGKMMSFLAQGVVGWVLTKGDFGVFATAASVAGFIAICRDAGVGQYLVQRGAAEYPRLSGPLFWLAMVFNSIAGLLVAVSAWPLAIHVYDSPELVPVLLVMALTVPMGTPASILGAKLRIDLRFRDISRFGLISVVVRYVLTIVLALALGSRIGAMCLAIPMLVTMVLDSLMCWWVTRDNPWRRGASIAVWIDTLRRTKWLMFGSVSNFALDMGPYVLLGGMLHKSSVGIFYFGFQITAQLGILLSWNLQQVLSAVFAKIAHDPVRLREAVVRSLSAQMLLGSFACLGLGVTFPVVERLVWRGRWDESGFTVLLLSVFFPWRISYGLCAAVQLATGRFRSYALLTAMEGVGFMLAAAAGALWAKSIPRPIGDESMLVALCAGVWLLASRLGVTVGVLRSLGVAPWRAAWAMIPAWALSLLVGAAVLNLDVRSDVAARIAAVVPAGVPRGLTDTLAYGLHAGLVGGACAAGYLLLLRVRMRDALRDTVSVLPERLRRPASGLLRMRSGPATNEETAATG